MHHVRHRQFMVSEEETPRKAKVIWVLLFILIWSVVFVYFAHQGDLQPAETDTRTQLQIEGR